LAKHGLCILSYCTPRSAGPETAGPGCSNKDIAAELHISPRTVKQRLRTLFLRAGIKQGRKPVILATAIFEKEQMNDVATRTVELPGNQGDHAGRTNPEIALTLGPSEQVIKHQLRSVFDKLRGLEPARAGPLRGLSWRRQLGR